MKRIKHSNYTYNDVPTIRRARTSFPVNYDVKTTLNIGEISVLDIQEVIPGDTFDVTSNFIIRNTSSLLRPVVDNSFLDIHHFYVRKRILWNDFEKMYTDSTGNGEPDDWQVSFNGREPVIPKGTVIPAGTVGDALGLPTGIPLGCDVSVLPFRAFAKVYNDWYRKEAFIKSCYIQTGDFSEDELPNSNAWSPNNYSGKLPKASKFADYFTSALPEPQKGEPVTISAFADGTRLPVRTYDELVPNATAQEPVRLTSSFGTGAGYGVPVFVSTEPSSATVEMSDKLIVDNSSGNETSTNAPTNLQFSNLWAFASGATAAIPISEWRAAFQLQKLRERSSRSGSRFVEFLLANFNVTSDDKTLQRAEFLGGRRTPLSYTSVSQTSQSSGADTLASQGAYGLTGGRSGFRKSFTEPGYIITTAVVRYNHNYQQGIAPMWRRLDFLSQVNPSFAHVGEQPIMATEIYGGADEERIFGYKPIYEELRRFQNKITRQMRSLSAGGSEVSQDVWHYADVYDGVPTLSQEWIQENSAFMGRTLAVSPAEQDPFLIDVFFKGRAVRCLPMFGTPELVDHF